MVKGLRSKVKKYLVDYVLGLVITPTRKTSLAIRSYECEARRA